MLIFAFTGFAICALVLLGGMGGKAPLSNEEAYQRFVGTWVNPDYPGTLTLSQITVIRPDYVGADWRFLDSANAEGLWSIRVKKTWVDQEGNTNCQFFLSYFKGRNLFGVGLMRVDKAGKVFKCLVRPKVGEEDTALYPKELPGGPA